MLETAWVQKIIFNMQITIDDQESMRMLLRKDLEAKVVKTE